MAPALNTALRCALSVASGRANGQVAIDASPDLDVLARNGDGRPARAAASARIVDDCSSLPRHFMNACMVMVEEALDQLPDPDAVTHVFMQGGVGSIAAAIFLGFAKRQPLRLPGSSWLSPPSPTASSKPPGPDIQPHPQARGTRSWLDSHSPVEKCHRPPGRS
jgi:hypothetical protein